MLREPDTPLVQPDSEPRIWGGPRVYAENPLRRNWRKFAQFGGLLWSVLLFCAALLALMWSAVSYQLSYEHNYALERRESENDNLARLFEEHVRRTLAAASVTLRQIETEYGRQGPRLDLGQHLHDRRDELAPYSALSLIDQHGDLVLASLPFERPQNFRTVENFQFHSRDTSRDVIISKPRRGTVTGKSMIYLSRRINNADGSFGGYTVAAMDPQYFSRFYDQIDLGKDSVVSLVGFDGIVRARRSNAPFATEDVAQDMRDASLFKLHLPQARDGRFRATSPIDGVMRLYSYRSVGPYPLVVLVGASEVATLAGFEERRRLYLWVAGGASAVIAAFAALLAVQMTREARVTESLRRSEERYALVERATNDGIWDRNVRSGKTTYLSPRGKEILGYREDEIQAEKESFFEWVHPDDAARVREAMAQNASDGKPYRIEYRLRHKDGRYIWVLSRGEMLRDKNGEPVRIIGAIADITEKKLAVDALEKSEKRLRQLLDEMLEGCMIVGFDWTYLYVNDAAARHGRQSRAQLTGRTMLEMYPGVERSEIFARYRHAMEQRAPGRFEASFNFPDGAIGWYQISVQPVPEGIFVLSLDITERKNSQKHVQEQSRLLDLIFSHSLDGLVILDKDYNFIRVNESYARMCQREVSEFPGRNHFAIFPSDFEQELEPFRREKKIYRRAARPFVFPDHPEWGTTYWDLGLVPILAENGDIELFLFTLKDVTGQIRAESKAGDYMTRIRALSARVVSVQEEERRAVARELHDEIGQGLTAVKIHLQAMERSCQGCELSFSMENLHEAMLTAGTILEQVRNLSLNLRPMLLDDLGLPVALRSLVARDAATAGWIAHFDEDLSTRRFDPDLELACYRMAQEALTNVMRHAEASEVWITLRQSDEALLLTVRDNGRGFELTGARTADGMPHLGLLGMEERVRNMAGQFEIRTSRGEGTEVQATFPLATSVADPAGAA